MSRSLHDGAMPLEIFHFDFLRVQEAHGTGSRKL